jgi:hypothetical protein
MALYGLSKSDWLSTFLALPNGIPSPDTFRRVFEKIRPDEFERCFELWVREVLDDLLPQFILISKARLLRSMLWALSRKLPIKFTKLMVMIFFC